MNLLNSSLLSGLAERLGFLASRSGVIAENIANADTPFYAARDVQKPSFQKMATRETLRAETLRAKTLRAKSLRVSDPRHIAAPARASSSARIISAPDGEASLNGNRVSLETQMMKLSETRMDYQLASTVYRKSVDMVRLAVRGGR